MSGSMESVREQRPVQVGADLCSHSTLISLQQRLPTDVACRSQPSVTLHGFLSDLALISFTTAHDHIAYLLSTSLHHCHSHDLLVLLQEREIFCSQRCKQTLSGILPRRLISAAKQLGCCAPQAAAVAESSCLCPDCAQLRTRSLQVPVPCWHCQHTP